MEGRFSDRPDWEHSNPLKPAMMSVCVSYALEKVSPYGNSPTLRGQFPSIPSIFGESTDMTSQPKPSP